MLNSGKMSHGTLGGQNIGLSKALVMSLTLLMRPLTDSIPLDFSEAWFPLDVSTLNHLHLDILRILNASVTKHFWVSQGWVYGLREGKYNYKITAS